MNDFTIRIKPMPHDAKYGDRDSILKSFLTAHFESIIKDKYAENEIEKRGSGDFDDIRNQNADKIAKLSEIADINFGRTKSWDLYYLNDLNRIRNEYLILNAQHKKLEQAMGNEGQEDGFEKKKAKLDKQFDKKRDEYLKRKEKEGSNNAQVSEGDKITGEAECKFAYITFKNMDAVDLILDKYEEHEGSCKRCCTMLCGGCCCAEDKAKL
jgi:hypothetical protein